jgi:hypothetical protein
MNAQVGRKSLAVILIEYWCLRSWGGQRQTPVSLPQGMRLGIYRTGGWVGPRARLNE